MPNPTAGAKIEILAENSAQLFDHGDCLDDKTFCSGKSSAKGQPFGFVTARKQTIMANLHKSRRKNMHEKSANKFFGGQRHGFHTTVIFVITPSKGNSTIFHVDNPVVGDGHTVGVAAEVGNHLMNSKLSKIAKKAPIKMDLGAMMDNFIEQNRGC